MILTGRRETHHPSFYSTVYSQEEDGNINKPSQAVFQQHVTTESFDLCQNQPRGSQLFMSEHN